MASDLPETAVERLRDPKALAEMLFRNVSEDGWSSEMAQAFIDEFHLVSEPIFAALTAALPHLGGEPVAPTHRHRKRGTEYVLIGYGKMQAENWRDISRPESPPEDLSPATVDMREVAIYRSATDPTEIWVRPREEFEDGRFEALPAAPVTPKNKDRHTFVVPKGHEAVFDSDGRATGETRPVTLGEGAEAAPPDNGGYELTPEVIDALRFHVAVGNTIAPTAGMRWIGQLLRKLDAAEARLAKAERERDEVRLQWELTQQTFGKMKQACREYSDRTEEAEARLAATDPLSDAARDVLAERRRQVEVEGWTPQHDDNTVDGTLALAAAAYAFASQYPDELRKVKGRPNWWPWAADWWKPTDRRRDLVKAGALILAEIERLDRALSGGAS